MSSFVVITHPVIPQQLPLPIPPSPSNAIAGGLSPSLVIIQVGGEKMPENPVNYETITHTHKRTHTYTHTCFAP